MRIGSSLPCCAKCCECLQRNVAERDAQGRIEYDEWEMLWVRDALRCRVRPLCVCTALELWHMPHQPLGADSRNRSQHIGRLGCRSPFIQIINMLTNKQIREVPARTMLPMDWLNGALSQDIAPTLDGVLS